MRFKMDYDSQNNRHNVPGQHCRKPKKEDPSYVMLKVITNKENVGEKGG